MHSVEALMWQRLWFLAIILIAQASAKSAPLHEHPAADTYSLALRKALVFFDAQKSGKLPKDNIVSWRGDSCIEDGDPGSDFSDLEGGYYDAGDAIKFHFPQAFAITMLSWSVLEYRAKYQAIGELSHVIDIIKWGTDYFLKTFPNSEFIQQLVTQVGTGDELGWKDIPNDHKCWMRPEDINYKRPVNRCVTCSDMASELAAAFASASVVLKDDKPYSTKLVESAKKLYVLARTQRGRYSVGNDAEIFYNSSGYWDEFIWGGTWLYYATGNLSYLTLVTKPAMAMHAGVGPDYGVHSWDNKLPGAQVLLSRLKLFFNGGYAYGDLLTPFLKQTGIVMCSYLPHSHRFNRTKGGMIKLNYGKAMPLQYVVNAVFLAKLFSDYLEASNIGGWHCGATFFSARILSKFARDQMDYILGKNPMNMSYVVGFGDRYPQQVHHRGASIPRGKSPVTCTGGYKWRDSKHPNPNVIVGAMVGGPDKYDGFQDVRTSFNYTEPTLAGNAGLVAALVALSGDGSSKIDKNATFLGYPPYFPII